MTGYVTVSDGAVWQLPALTTWQIERTDGDPCDSFSVTFPAAAAQRTVLTKAVRFHAIHEEKTVFTGVVDEFELQESGSGLTATLSGRGLAALLMDSQVRAAEYCSAGLKDILAAYVTPFGVTKVSADSLPALSGFTVDSGTTSWAALSGYCLHAGGIRPRFLADGTLELKKSPSVGQLSLASEAAVLEASWRDCRYDVPARIIQVDKTTGVETTVKNTALLAVGGQTQKVCTVASGTVLRAAFRTAQQRLDEAIRDWRTASVTLPGLFLAAPRDYVFVSRSELGLTQTLRVRTVRSVLDESGARCTLELGTS